MNTIKEFRAIINEYKTRRLTLILPQAQQVFPSLIASEIVSVQPMSLPTGILFYLDYQYSSSIKKKS